MEIVEIETFLGPVKLKWHRAVWRVQFRTQKSQMYSFSVFYMFFHAFQSVEHNGTWSLIQR